MVTSYAHTWIGPVGSAHIAVVLRYDDYSAKSDTAADNIMISCLKRFDVPATFGVIPHVCACDILDPAVTTHLPLSGEKLRMLKEAVESQGIEVALHGYSHQVNRLAKRSEFVGLGFDEQREKILKGRSLLHEELGIRPETFIPPYNSYDSVTLSVLENLGFRTISSDLYAAPPPHSGLRFLPSTCTLGNLRNAIASARRSGDPRPFVVVMIHPCDLDTAASGASAPTQEGFEGTLGWLSSQPDVEIKSIGQLVGRGEDLQMDRYRSYRLAKSGLPSTLPFLRLKPQLFYPSVPALTRIRRRQTVANWLFLGGLLLAVTAIIASLRALLGDRGRHLVFGVGLASCAAVVLFGLQGILISSWSYRRLIVYAALLGIVIAAWA